MGGPVDGREHWHGTWEDKEQFISFIPLSLLSGTLRCLSFLGSLQAGKCLWRRHQRTELLPALPGPDRLFPTEPREENGISAFLFHGKCF